MKFLLRLYYFPVTHFASSKLRLQSPVGTQRPQHIPAVSDLNLTISDRVHDPSHPVHTNHSVSAIKYMKMKLMDEKIKIISKEKPG